MINRRQLLILAGSGSALGMGSLMPTAFGQQHEHGHHVREPRSPIQTPLSRPVYQYDTPLRLPGSDGLFGTFDGDAPFTVTARPESLQLLPGRPTELWSYTVFQEKRQFMNPILRIAKGRTIRATLLNALQENTTIHWHGLHVDTQNDGSGMHPVAPGTRREYSFTVNNRAGLYWYHAHPHDRTGAQIHQGLAGLLLVQDETELALQRALDLHWGENDIPLLIQDKRIDAKNRIRHRMGDEDWLGNRLFVNFTPEPKLAVKRRLYRLRLLNASNARTFLIAFRNGSKLLPFHLIGTDGGLLDKPYRMQKVFLAPAQRIDILVDFSRQESGNTIWLSSLAYDPMENDLPPGMPVIDEGPHLMPMGEALDLLRLEVGTASVAAPALPSHLDKTLDASRPAAQTRKFRLHTDGRRWYINGMNFHDDMQAVHFAVRKGSREVWEIRNESRSMPHPMHLHGFQFRVLSRHRSPLQVRELAMDRFGRTPQDLGFLDTVLVWPGETVRIVIDFTTAFPGPQTYMFHCHNLEHEDQGMMLHFRCA